MRSLWPPCLALRKLLSQQSVEQIQTIAGARKQRFDSGPPRIHTTKVRSGGQAILRISFGVWSRLAGEELETTTDNPRFG